MKLVTYCLFILPILLFGQDGEITSKIVFNKEVVRGVNVKFEERSGFRDGEEITPYYYISVFIVGCSIEYSVYNPTFGEFHKIRGASVSFPGPKGDGLKDWFIEVNRFGHDVVNYDIYKDEIDDIYELSNDKKIDKENYKSK